MKIKDGASVKGVQWQMFDAALKVEKVYSDYGQQLTITAGSDGQHGPHSLHYQGLALDLRTRDVPLTQMPKILRDVKQALGKDFDCVLESDHLHIEFQPKG